MKIDQIISLNETTQDFEKVAFGDLKGDAEKDTAWETKVFTSIANFMIKSTPQNKARATGILKDVEVLKSRYPSDLLPNAQLAMRGTQLTSSHYKKYLSAIDDFSNMDQDDLIHVDTIRYAPHSPIQSWTTDRYTAAAFASTGEVYKGIDWNADRPHPAVLIANVDPTFIMSTVITNKIADHLDMEEEYEIIRTSAKPISCKVYVVKSWLSSYMEMQTK